MGDSHPFLKISIFDIYFWKFVFFKYKNEKSAYKTGSCTDLSLEGQPIRHRLRARLFLPDATRLFVPDAHNREGVPVQRAHRIHGPDYAGHRRDPPAAGRNAAVLGWARSNKRPGAFVPRSRTLLLRLRAVHYKAWDLAHLPNHDRRPS